MCNVAKEQHYFFNASSYTYMYLKRWFFYSSVHISEGNLSQNKIKNLHYLALENFLMYVYRMLCTHLFE
jgi:hypothetical protein